MFSGTTSESAGRTSESVASPVNPQGVRRESVYSDRAVFALSRSPERSLRPYGSTSPPPTMPPAAYSRPSDGSGRTSTGNRAYGSDDQLPNSPYLQQPQSRYQQRQQSHEQSPRQQSHEQDSRQQSIVALSGRPQTRGEPAAASKSYGLPATSDAVGRAQNDPYRRARVERDYSQGESRQFSVTMPEQLNGRIDEQQFKKFVRRLNRLLAEAEGATLRNVLEGCLAYATLYV
ncbi:Golgin sub A member 7, partial [Coemansia erecta]